MKRAMQKHLRDVLAIAVLAVIAVLVGGYILSNQRFYAPSWVPLVGSDFVDYQAEMATAQAFTAGQGQTVMIAGVNVGEIGQVTLKDGRARITMKIKKKYTPIYRDALALSRPKTGLNDMTIELDPGHKSAGVLPGGGVIPISQTLPNVNPDEFLAGLDTETRSYIQLLLGGAGQGLRGNAANLSATLKRFDPTARYVARITRLLSKRTTYISRAIHNFRLLSEALGGRDTQLAQFVDSSNKVFQSFANVDSSLQATIRELPPALQSTNAALKKSEALTSVLGPTLTALQPTAKGLAPALQAFQSFAKDTKPVIENQIGPFTETAQAPAAALRPAAADLAATQPQLASTFEVLNQLFNGLAYNPPGKQEGYLYWLAWANHTAASLLSSQDAHGPTRRGVILGSCDSLRVFEAVSKANAILGTLIKLLNAPSFAEVCGSTQAKAAATAQARAILTKGAAQGDPIQAATLRALGDEPPAAGTATTTGGTAAAVTGR
jgi:phospholipid/cholesterol/gamma-HCH transport system substrate-binding protein